MGNGEKGSAKKDMKYVLECKAIVHNEINLICSPKCIFMYTNTHML